jgi:lantibiotic modifying enzyme
VRDAFLDAGIDWDFPHLEQGDAFGLRTLRFEAADQDRPRHTTAAAAAALENAALERASHIGRELCADALWHADRCTWLTDDVEDANGRQMLFTRTMNGNLYDGTLGVASFLVPLAAATGEAAFAEVAAAALRHALQHSTTSDASLYEGRLGVVAGGLVLSEALGEAKLAHDYREEASHIIATLPEATTDADLMHGMAGAVLCLLQIARSIPQSAGAAMDVARGYGHALCALARRSDKGWHWPANGAALGLCGLSHGNAGIAVAFAELERVDSDTVWRDALKAALAYEKHWFLPSQGNWPYLFAEDAQSLDDRPQSCGMAWCHGAPGIALSRLALWRITRNAAYLKSATIALQTVASDLSRPAPTAGMNDSLCHGPLGNADILLTASQVLDDPQWRDAAARAAREAIARYATDPTWQSGLGVDDGTSAGLMLGVAGTGYFLLRLAQPTVPLSALLPFVPSLL